MESVLSIKGLEKSYSKFLEKEKKVLDGVNFDIKKNTLTGFLGANGSGKTTTIKCILGLVQYQAGKIEIFGSNELTMMSKREWAFCQKNLIFYDHLTGNEFLSFSYSLCDQNRKERDQRIEEALSIVGLSHAGDFRIREYSKGMYQRIGIAQSFIHNPDFIILDEPMSGLDPQGRSTVKKTLKSIRERGVTVILSSHLLQDIEDLCENLVILKEGKCAFEGLTEDFLKKIQTGFEIHYSLDGEKIEKEVPDLKLAQKEIDQIRSQGGKILLFSVNRPSLEDAFVEFVTGDSK